MVVVVAIGGKETIGKDRQGWRRCRGTERRLREPWNLVLIPSSAHERIHTCNDVTLHVYMCVCVRRCMQPYSPLLYAPLCVPVCVSTHSLCVCVCVCVCACVELAVIDW